MAITFRIPQVEATRDGSGLVKLDVYAMDGEAVIRHQEVTVPAEAAALTADSKELSADLEKLVLENAPDGFDKSALSAIVAANEMAQAAAAKLQGAIEAVAVKPIGEGELRH